ncbi:hypothetical protein FRC03_005040 [Tulasnella sp. 419]|nr:hypothetical protein FRC03_005040 [Tulasnella sp. 419]
MLSEDDLEREPLLHEQLTTIPVYPIIHLIKADVIHYIDTPLSYEALTAPDLTYSLVQPLYEKYSRMRNMSTVFCFLLNRVHFLRDKSLPTIPLSQSRAALCELMATKLLRDWADNLLELATVMTTSWFVFSGAGADVLQKADEEREDLDVKERLGNAIEMAIVGQAKRFIKSDAAQKVIDAIWAGKIVYQAESDHAILSDTYKLHPLHFYDPRKAPLLDHYRLKVPAVRSVLEYISFLTLFITYVIALEGNELSRINWCEGIFMIYATGFTLDKAAAMQEHGMKVYSANLWNAFDVMFITIFVSYCGFRFYGLHYHQQWAMNYGTDILALGACLMFPRLAFVTLSNNLMILSLRSMFVEFIVLMLVAVFCFCGFFYALWTLSRATTYQYTPGTIFWWMLDLYFGLDASGFDRATTFHPIFGPVLLITYCCLSNTLLLTVLVSILSHTFSTISSDALAESMFRRAVTTIEGVKADALFSYQPPLNLFAFVVMLPMSYILNRRWFHKVNVFFIRVTAFPILITIAFYERQKIIHSTTTMAETVSGVVERVFDSLPRRLKRLTFFEGMVGTGGDIDAIFELEAELEDEALIRRISMPDTRSPNISPPDTMDGKKNGAVIWPASAPQSPPPGSRPTSEPTTPVPTQTQPQNPAPSLRPNSPPRLNLDGASHLRERRGSTRRDSRRLSSGALDAIRTGITSSITSPLAQLFQPVVFDDEPEDLTEEPNRGAPATSTAVSFGPAMRRVSKQQRGTTEAHPLNAIRRRTQSALVGDRPIIRPGLLGPLTSSPSPDRNLIHGPSHLSESHPVEPETVTEIESDEEDMNSRGLNTVVEKRLEEIEKRQKRIEDLLIKLSGQLGDAPRRSDS